MRKNFRIALAGNPNCGKTCIFNSLTGARQHVGNYPGVTVESKSGSFSLNGMEIEVIDLPGVYSLSSSSPEEAVVFDELTKPGIDLIVNVIDSTIPQRSMYLTTQLAEGAAAAYRAYALTCFSKQTAADEHIVAFRGTYSDLFHFPTASLTAATPLATSSNSSGVMD